MVLSFIRPHRLIAQVNDVIFYVLIVVHACISEGVIYDYIYNNRDNVFVVVKIFSFKSRLLN